MKTLYLLLLVLTVSLNFGCKKAEPATIPVVSTTEVTGLTESTATCGGNITSDGKSAITLHGVCWSTNINPTIKDSKTANSYETGPFVCVIDGLTAGTTYHVRAYATNSVGTAYGEDKTFTTLGQAPTATTQPATNISATAVTLNGIVNANYLSTAVTFEYGNSTSYGSTATANPGTVTGNNNTNVTAIVTGLTAVTIYHFRIITLNALGKVYGDDVTFTTKETGQAPTATTQPATNIYATAATLNGIVNANGLSATVTFEYGTTESYGSTATTTQSPVTGDTSTSVSADITGLKSGNTYNFRVKAENSNGTVYGSNIKFTLSACNQIPTVTTLPVSNISSHGGTFNGAVNANGLSTTVKFFWCVRPHGSGCIGQYWSAEQSPIEGNSTIHVSKSVSGLVSGIGLYYNVQATNACGTTLGKPMPFRTLAESAPTATTDQVTNISDTSAILNGTVNASNLSTTIIFEYGTTTSYGNTEAANPGILTGNTNVSVCSYISGLTSNTNYHFRVKAENSKGIVYGDDKTFTTH